MDELIVQTIKLVATLLMVALVLGTLGALALSNGVVIAGAVCFLIAGILVGVLIGIFISNLGVEDDVH